MEQLPTTDNGDDIIIADNIVAYDTGEKAEVMIIRIVIEWLASVLKAINTGGAQNS